MPIAAVVWSWDDAMPIAAVVWSKDDAAVFA